jgi:AraC family transcriptional regulator, exoenzyme S synthesis regulatory protein ExsA
MTVQYLPNDLAIASHEHVQLFDYNRTDICVKNKISLTQNVLSFLIEGSKQLITQNKSITINTEQFLLVKSGNCIISENLSSSNAYRSLMFFFSDSILMNFLEKNKIPIVHSKSPKPYHVYQYDAYIQHYIESLKKIQSYENPFQYRLLQTKFEEIMVYLMHKNGTEFLQAFLNGQDNHTLHFIRVVESNSLNNLTIQELAFLCNMSISTFKREFEKNYQTSPIKWFQEKRLEHSAFLLSTKKRRPTDLYTEIGFESLSSFTQAFKQKFGTTPKQYQLENQAL